MLIGYARVSTLDQTLALQQDALTASGCQELYTDTVSGSVTDRPGLSQALSHLRLGDTLVVWRLDRLGRSLPHLIETVRQLQERGVGFRSLQEQIDTTTSGGKLVFHVFGALAEFERDLIRERTHAGLAAARARGRLFGQGRGKVRIAGLTCGDPDCRPRPASAGTSVAWICSWGVLLLPRSERPGGSSADETTALGAAPQPPHDDIRPGQVLVWRLCLGPGETGPVGSTAATAASASVARRSASA